MHAHSRGQSKGVGTLLLSYFVAALTCLALAYQTTSRAEAPKTVRITLARSVSAIPLWGIGPFAEKAGFHVDYIPTGTNADMQRNIRGESNSAPSDIRAPRSWPNRM